MNDAEKRARELFEEFERQWEDASDVAALGGDELASARLRLRPGPDYRQESPEVKDELLRLFGEKTEELRGFVGFIKAFERADT